MPRDRLKMRRLLQRAAFELFQERGYDQTTAAEIAARAGVTERTFFRHFADKREVPFAGSDDLRAALVKRILQAPDAEQPLLLVTTVLSEFDWESVASRGHHRQRHALINANPALVERDLMKYRSLAVDFAEALCQRGVNVNVARLTAEVGIDIFVAAYQQWLAVGNEEDLPTINKIMLSLLAKIMPRRDTSTDS